MSCGTIGKQKYTDSTLLEPGRYIFIKLALKRTLLFKGKSRLVKKKMLIFFFGNIVLNLDKSLYKVAFSIVFNRTRVENVNDHFENTVYERSENVLHSELIFKILVFTIENRCIPTGPKLEWESNTSVSLLLRF